MKPKSIKLIYFSPTGTTKKILQGITRGMKVNNSEEIDLTRPGARELMIQSSSDELVILGAPVYGGRLQEDAAEIYKQIDADNTPSVLVVTYGNREYEDSLLELRDIAEDAGFKPVAAAAFIGEHSFSTRETPIAHGRPDKEDMAKAEYFGRQIMDKLGSIKNADKIESLSIPGNNPYKSRNKRRVMDIFQVTDECKECGVCAESCPVEAVSRDDIRTIEYDRCILCLACIKNCSAGARQLDDEMIKGFAQKLSTMCSDRKEPVIFLY